MSEINTRTHTSQYIKHRFLILMFYLIYSSAKVAHKRGFNEKEKKRILYTFGVHLNSIK